MVTNGASGVTGGEARAAFWGAASVIAAVALAVASVNALTVNADRQDFATWEPWSWELTSIATALCLMWAPWLAVRRVAPGRASWPRLLLVHGAGAFVYSVLHVTGFVLLREAVYALQGLDYDFGPIAERFPYELRKDVLTYLGFASAFWIALRLREGGAPNPPPLIFDIRDGPRIIRVGANDIVAVTAAGNYAEFILTDGRRPLMRATLARLEVELGSLGLIRSHRSWLVNPAHLTGLEPDGSGDWTVELGAVRAPVSRRYPQALERIRS